MRRRTMVLVGSLALAGVQLGVGGAPAVAGPQRPAGAGGPVRTLADFDWPVTGDWDGDGDDTVAIWRGNTFHLRNSNSNGPANSTFAYGSSATDFPISGDWNGDGDNTVGVFRGNTFFLRNTATVTTVVSFGRATDFPVTGDWDGDGTTTPGVVRDNEWFLRNSATSTTAFRFGSATDYPVTGDWNGDGDQTIGVVRGSTWFLRNTNSEGNADLAFPYTP